MIASISGRVLETRVDGLVINIGGVGMFVLCAPDIIANSKIGEEFSVQTALIVREDSLTLFGFATAESRELFELVQSVSGFGPKLAFTILASLSAQEFKNALANEDVARLRQIPGVGAKGAQRLVLELKDRVGVATGDRVRATGWQDQVEQGLIGLGWTSKEAAKAVLAVQDSGVSDEDVATLLKRALQILAN